MDRGVLGHIHTYSYTPHPCIHVDRQDRRVACLHHVVEDGDLHHEEAGEGEDTPDVGVPREEVEA